MRLSHLQGGMFEEQESMLRRILVIEDDRDFAHLVESHLTEMGFEMTLAAGGLSVFAQGIGAR